jgi:peptidoglycan/xylan/chitin deacetylase (PgdA/CDA1 family)
MTQLHPSVFKKPALRASARALAATMVLACSGGFAHAQEMAITFDDLPAHGPLPAGMTRLDVATSILDTLQRQHLPPTYGFINGGRGTDEATSPAVLEAWRAAGQPLGNHTWAHHDLSEETAEQFETDVTANEPLLTRLMGKEDWHWLRYPVLHEGDTLAKRRTTRQWLLSRGYRIAETSMDFEDYLWNAPYARCLAKHDAASIQRLHDSYLEVADQYYAAFREASRRTYGRDVKYVLLMHVGAFDAHMLPELLALYRSKGVHFISMPEALADPAYRDDPDIAARNGGTHLELMLQSKHLPFPANSKPYRQLEAMCL